MVTENFLMPLSWASIKCYSTKMYSSTVLIITKRGNKPLTFSLSITKTCPPWATVEEFTIKSHYFLRVPLSMCVRSSVTKSYSSSPTHFLTCYCKCSENECQSFQMPFTENVKPCSAKDSCSGLGDHLSQSVVLISVTCNIPHTHTAAISVTTSSSASKL